jgi:hypothetical protein
MGQDSDLVELVQAYGAAFKERDLEACVDAFRDDATVKFLFATYQGREAIEKWHADRFDLGAELLALGPVRADGDTAVVEVEATSKRLRLFKINRVKGKIEFRAREGRFAEVRFSARKGAYSHLNWQFQ